MATYGVAEELCVLPHTWRRDDEGDLEYVEFTDRHGGYVCVICYEASCIHCEPDTLERRDCPGEKLMSMTKLGWPRCAA